MCVCVRAACVEEELRNHTENMAYLLGIGSGPLVNEN